MNEKWMFLSIAEVEQKLNTSAASGLSRKAARARLQKAGENAFFLLPHTGLADNIRAVAAQPSVVLLLILGFLMLFFEQPTQGKTLLLLTVLYAILLVAARMWSGGALRFSARAARPLVRVIREGQMYLLDAARLVPGDLVELESGDMIPCDLRLVTSENLRVLTYLGSGKGEGAYARTLKDAAHVATEAEQNDICLHANMLYGGSVIEQGQARALVVETGKHTYIGALQGGFPLKTGQTLPEAARRHQNVSARLQIVLLLAVLPLLCLCLWIGRNQAGLPLLFSTLLCLCLANLAGNMDTVLKFGMSLGIRRALTSGSSGETALIKTEKDPDRLAEFDVLFLLGTHAFSEDVPTPQTQTKRPDIAGSPFRETDEDTRRREMRMVLSEHFLASREDCLDTLRRAGITPILFLENDSRESVTYALRTGIAATPSEIASAGQFRAQGRHVTAGFGQYHAYCGFDNAQLKDLLIFLKKAGKRVAVLADHASEYPLLKEADVRFVCVDDMSVFTDSDRTREKRPQISRGKEDVSTRRLRRGADVLVPRADRRHGGLGAVVHTLHTVSDTRRNLTTLARYLLYTQLVRMTLALPAMLGGINMLTPVQAMFSGLFVDLFLSFLLLTRVGGGKSLRLRNPAGANWARTAVEAVSAGTLTLTAFLFIYRHEPNGTSAAASLFVALLLIQLTAFFLHWDPRSLFVAANRKTLLCAAAGCLLFFLIAWLFGWLAPLGFDAISSPYGYLALIAPMSVVLVSVVVYLYRLGRSR